MTDTFKHALIQDTAYGSLLRDRRAELHGSIGAVLEREFPDTMKTAPEILAHHFTEARIPEAGAKYWLRAGESALRRSAMLEGSAHLEAGLGVAETLPSRHGHDELLVRLHLARASALRQACGPMNPDVTESYSKAYELSQGLEDSQLRFSASVSWLAANSARAESSNVLKHAQELVNLAGSDPAQLGMAQMVLGEILLMQGRSEIAVPHLTQATELYDPSSHAITAIEYGRDFGVFSGALHAIALTNLGFLDKALAVVRELVKQGESRSFFHLYALTFETFVLMLRRDIKDLLIAAENLIELCEQVGFPASVHSAQLQSIWARSLINEYDNGAQKVESIISEMQLPLWLRPWYHAMLAEVYLREEQYADALKVVEETLVWSNECGIVHYDSPLFVIQGDALIELDLADSTSGESCYARALDIAQSQSAKYFELRAATRIARLWQSQGKTTEARDLLAPVYGWFTEGFDTADLKEAKALLDELN